jgi:hypothetical protein
LEEVPFGFIISYDKTVGQFPATSIGVRLPEVEIQSQPVGIVGEVVIVSGQTTTGFVEFVTVITNEQVAELPDPSTALYATVYVPTVRLAPG